MRQPFASALASGLLCLLAPGAAALGDEWPGFRGPDGTGVSRAEGLPERWSATENVTWSVGVAGRGWSSPIVTSGRVFVTSAVPDGEDVEARKGLYFGGEQSDPPAMEYRWTVACLDAATGEARWERVAHHGRPQTPIHVKNSYASATPVSDGERIFARFCDVGVFAYDLDGKELWKRRLEPVATRRDWGGAASLAHHEGRLFVVNDNEDASYLMALDAKSGETLWRIERDEASNWATPFVWETDERTELVTAGSRRVRSYDLDGAPLWELAGMSRITIATPYAAGGLLYVTSGFVMDRSRPVYAIRPGATGDISPGGERGEQALAWSLERGAPYNPSTLVYDGRLYVLLDAGFLACYDATSGEELYGKQRLGGRAGFTASPWAYGGKVFCLDEDGETFVVRTGDAFELSHTNSLSEMCMATPAIAAGSLFVRTQARLFCLRAAAD
ncbi:MAG: PQQ-binding-like beta-propeller repeat protein [Planctomycetota bacterium]|jgi:outer membrane protein assembly factor BamB|nr:PQQ-binding-like beta-propeller repeat protein [Planctomycetota bacterium]MDP6763179.1 PQQ-binding-like beta-propeller repeat protein [Planctomycetota bacterium]MDP6989837.1 PQQ-binding-like beta-propeller repeat protein [Planctomycetota bacterium]